jgi:hypothetical protein
MEKHIFITPFFRAALPLLAAVILCAILPSCTDEPAINSVLGSDAEAPVFISYRAVSGTEIEFQFSAPVKVVDAYVDTKAEFEDFPDSYEPTVALKFKTEHSGGSSITVGFLVEDADGNSLNLLVPFKTRNDRMPEAVLNEIRLNYTKPSVEFIELYIKNAGNLGAMRLFVASTSTEEAVYEFPSVEVKAGEYVTLHLRTLDASIEVDELDSNLKKSKASKPADANDEARDIWAPGSLKYLHSTDVIYLLDQDDRIIDAVVIALSQEEWSKNKTISKAAELMAKQGAWLNMDGEAVKTPIFADAVDSNGVTPTRTLCRDETRPDSNTKQDWYICFTSNASPGGENSQKRYEPSVKSVSKSR